MGSWQYRKKEPSHIRGVCVRCQKHPQKQVAKQNKYRPLCSVCTGILYRSPEGKEKDAERRRNSSIEQKRPYRKHVKSFCESCGFVPQHMCQLDVDHIDGNNSNNDLTNLQTLCANCHRLKTFLNKDWL
jgi:5-methylcytosine-specific restriction endonuclease McrA